MIPFLASPYIALFTLASFLAFLIDIWQGIGSIANPIASGIFAVIVLLITQKIRDRRSAVRDAMVNQGRAIDASISIAKITEEARRAAEEQRDDYVEKIERFYQEREQYWITRDKERQASLEIQKELLAADQVIIANLRQTISELQTQMMGG